MNLNVRDSPVSVCLVSMLLISLAYLVYIHPQQFESFAHFVLILGSIVLTGLIIAGYKPFVRYCREDINENCKMTSFKPHIDYHDQVKQNTKKQVDELMRSEKYQEFRRKKEQSHEVPVVLCENKTLQEIEHQAKQLQELQTQIFQDQQNPLGNVNEA